MGPLYTHVDAAATFASLARVARRERKYKRASEYWVLCLIALLRSARR
jgi:hypothetical protein